MLRFCIGLFVLFTGWHCTAAMKCVFSNGNEISSQFGLSSAVECPRMWEDRDKIFCCLKDSGQYYCCDADEFETNLGFNTRIIEFESKSAGIVIAIAVGAIVIVCVILSICCCCCPCCCLYKRRHRGTVYGNMPQPGVHTTVVTVPQPVMVPTHTPMYPPGVQQPGVALQAQPPQPGFYPPTYDEAMVKQAPYNPNY